MPVGSAGAAFGMVLEGSVQRSGSARLRAGYAFDQTLAYATAGVALARYKMDL